MKGLIFFALVYISGAVSLESSSASKAAKGGGNINLISLGNIEGKSYFYDHSARRNWLESRDYCREYGMEIATIKTEGQYSFLKSKYNKTTFGEAYWIGARDSKQLRALSWDDTNLELDPLPTSVQMRYYVPEFQICLLYYNSGTEQALLMYLCSFTNFDVGVLCET